MAATIALLKTVSRFLPLLFDMDPSIYHKDLHKFIAEITHGEMVQVLYVDL